jgi:hypothetical protein
MRASIKARLDRLDKRNLKPLVVLFHWDGEEPPIPPAGAQEVVVISMEEITDRSEVKYDPEQLGVKRTQ